MSKILDAMREIRSDLRAVIDATLPDWPPEQINAPPTLLVYPQSGPSRMGSADGGNGRATFWNTDTVIVRLLVPRKSLPHDVELLSGFVDPVRRAIIGGFVADRFGGSTTILGERDGGNLALSYEIEAVEWGGQDMLSLTFSMPVTTEDEVG